MDNQRDMIINATENLRTTFIMADLLMCRRGGNKNKTKENQLGFRRDLDSSTGNIPRMTNIGDINATIKILEELNEITSEESTTTRNVPSYNKYVGALPPETLKLIIM